MTAPLEVGDRVRPACDGSNCRWTMLRGVVVKRWEGGTVDGVPQYRLLIRWDKRHKPLADLYGFAVPEDLLVRAD